MYRINCSNKEEWGKFLDFIKNEKVDEVIVYVDDRHQVHNLIYFLIAKNQLKKDEKIDLKIEISEELISETNKDEEDLAYEISALFFLANIKITFINLEKSKKRLFGSKHKFDKTMPFMIFDKNIDKLNNIEDDFIKLVLSHNYNRSYNEIWQNNYTDYADYDINVDFLKIFIKEKYNKIIADLKNETDEEIITCIKRTMYDLNLLSLSIFLYFINNIDVSELNIIYINDLKHRIRKLSVGLYQIIENSIYHSCSKCAFCYFSLLDMVRQKRFNSFNKYILQSKNHLTKKNSYMSNFNYSLNEENYIFIRIIDDIRNLNKKNNEESLNHNIVDSFEKINGYNEALVEKNRLEKNYISKLTSIYDLLQNHQEIFDFDKENTNVSSKYGLMVFLEAATALNMQFVLNSGNEKFLFSENEHFRNRLFFEEKFPINNCVSEYCCAFPTIIKGEHISNSNNSKINFKLMDNVDMGIVDIDFDVFLKKYNAENVTVTNHKLKEGMIKYYGEQLTTFFNNLENDQIIRINILSTKNTEILVKILSNLLLKVYQSNKKCYLLINFIDVENNKIYSRLTEFIQFLKISNIKLEKIINADDDKHGNFQIAFFHTLKEKQSYISTMVSLKWPVMVYSFINNLIYDNDFDNNNYFNLYINDVGIDNIKIRKEIELLPFELSVKSEDGTYHFLDKLKKISQNKSIAHKRGNILLESGLYLKDFYEAEHIFYNKSIVSKIALLIKRDIKKNLNLKDDYKVCIVGYANYSHLLCEEIKKYLGDDSKIVYIPDVNSLDNIEKYKIKTRDENMDNYYFVSVLPIGSSLYTFYKMNLYIRSLFKIPENKYIFNLNYCVFTVSPKTKEKNIYWEENKNDGIFTDIKFKNDNKIIIKRLINLDTEWSDKPGVDLAISNVDKTSTIPFIIHNHSLNDKENNFDIKNFEKFKCLNGAVKYGHFGLSNNHYLFYINHENILNQEKNILLKIGKDLEKYGDKVDKFAYNIIISPINNNNNSFLNLVVNNVFCGNATIIQFDTYLTLRENFISKNKYVLDNIKKVLTTSVQAKVNIYFVDNTIVSGKTINRAKELITSLINSDSFVSENHRLPNRLFEKIFLLENRCNDNTVKTIAEDSNNLYNYIKINCPLFETVANICPDCKITENYNKLANMITEADVSKKFKEYAKRHKLKHIKENTKLEYNKLDFARLCFTHLILENKNLLFNIYDKFFLKEPINFLKCHEEVNNFYENIKDIIVSKTNIVLSELELKKTFIKVLSRPFVTLYEKIKQVSFIYLKNEFEEICKTVDIVSDNRLDDKSMIKKAKEEDLPSYILTVIERLSYYGTNYLEINKVNLEKLKIKKILNDKDISKNLIFEKVLSKGIIK